MILLKKWYSWKELTTRSWPVSELWKEKTTSWAIPSKSCIKNSCRQKIRDFSLRMHRKLNRPKIRCMLTVIMRMRWTLPRLKFWQSSSLVTMRSLRRLSQRWLVRSLILQPLKFLKRRREVFMPQETYHRQKERRLITITWTSKAKSHPSQTWNQHWLTMITCCSIREQPPRSLITFRMMVKTATCRWFMEQNCSQICSRTRWSQSKFLNSRK